MSFTLRPVSLLVVGLCLTGAAGCSSAARPGPSAPVAPVAELTPAPVAVLPPRPLVRPPLPEYWLRFQSQATGLCAGFPKGRARHLPFGLGGDGYALYEGNDVAIGARDFQCSGQSPLLLGPRGDLGYVSYEPRKQPYFEVRYVEPRAVAIAAFGHEPCVLIDDGSIRCPRSGDVRSAHQTLADQLFAEGPMAQLVPGTTCAITFDGQLTCGAVGATSVAKLWTGVRQASLVGGPYELLGCAVLLDGSVECMGDNRYGQRGVKSVEDPSKPNKVPGLRDIVEVAASGAHVCARDAHGAVFCWGYSGSRELGSDGFAAAEKVPSCPIDDVATAAQRKAIEELEKCSERNQRAGRDDRRRDDVCGRQLWNMGSPGPVYKQDGFCQVGPTPGRFLTRPIRVREVKDAVAIAVRGSMSCALTAREELMCWGFGVEEPRVRKIPAGTMVDPRPVMPPPIFEERPSLSVSAQNGVCVRDADGTLARLSISKEGTLGGFAPVSPEVADHLCSAWTYCSLGKDGVSRCLGPDGKAPASSPTPAPEQGRARLRRMYGSLCLLREDGVLRCGSGFGSQDASTRVGDLASAYGPVADPVDFAPCSLFTDGTVGCGYGDPGGYPTIVWRGVKRVAGSAGSYSLDGCAVMLDGTVQCLGRNALGQRGVRGELEPKTPNVVPGLSGMTEISEHSGHVCALSRKGEVFCWGNATRGQTGRAAFERAEKIPVCPLDAAAMRAEKGRLSEADPACRGEARAERCAPLIYRYSPGCETPADGAGTRFLGEPLRVEGISDAVAVGVGDGISCALLADGAVACWGGGSPDVRVARPR